MPPDEIAPPFRINPRHMDRSLALDVSHDLGNRVVRRDRFRHVHGVGRQMPLFDPAFLPRGQLLENFPEATPRFAIQHLPAAFGNEHYVVFAPPQGAT